MGVIAIIVNCALIGVSGQIQRMIPGASRETVIVIIVLLEVNTGYTYILDQIQLLLNMLAFPLKVVSVL